MHRYALLITYDGTDYAGWQIQENSVTVQAVLEKALSTALRSPVDLHGAGRTDAGVHAMGQVAHFTIEQEIDPLRLRGSLNGLLPRDIRVREVNSVDENFHARYSAKRKNYQYFIHAARVHDPFQRSYAYHIPWELDLNEVRKAASSFIGTHDFASFANETQPERDTVRTLYGVNLVEEGPKLRIEFEGNGFLYKMVRNMVGTLLEVGRGNRAADSIPALLQTRDRTQAGSAAPPHGLFLMKVTY